MDTVTVHKYQFDLGDEIEIVVQGSLRGLLSIQKQNGIWCAWVEVMPLEGEQSYMRLFVVGTGHPVPALRRHFTTVQDGYLVWHFYA